MAVKCRYLRLIAPSREKLLGTERQCDGEDAVIPSGVHQRWDRDEKRKRRLDGSIVLPARLARGLVHGRHGLNGRYSSNWQ